MTRFPFQHSIEKISFIYISDEVTANFNWPDLSSSTIAMGLTQHLTAMTNKNLPGGCGAVGRLLRLTTSAPSLIQL
jgi:hypothetical protein